MSADTFDKYFSTVDGGSSAPEVVLTPGNRTRRTPIFARNAVNRRLGCPSGRTRRQVRWCRTRHHRRRHQRPRSSRAVHQRCRCRRSSPTCHGHQRPRLARITPPGGPRQRAPSRDTGRPRRHWPFRHRRRPPLLHQVLRPRQQCPQARSPSQIRGRSMPGPRMRR